MNHSPVNIRSADRADIAVLARLRSALWPDGSVAAHAAELADAVSGERHGVDAILVAESGGGLVGFAELSLRSTADGCETTPVGYLEGWYVTPEVRRRGIGRALVEAAERWAAGRGCAEFASDTTLDNLASAAAHRALGFTEGEILRTFRKRIAVR